MNLSRTDSGFFRPGKSNLSSIQTLLGDFINDRDSPSLIRKLHENKVEGLSNCSWGKSEPLEKVDEETKKLMDDMLETMYAAPGIGLAAIQVGILKRLVVIDISKGEEEKKPMFFINPKISRVNNKEKYS